MNHRFFKYVTIFSRLELFLEWDSDKKSPLLYSVEDGVGEFQLGPLYVSVNAIKPMSRRLDDYGNEPPLSRNSVHGGVP